MSLDDYLRRKQAALDARRADWTATPAAATVRIAASSTLAGNTGVRPTRMGAHSIISDSAPGMAGHALGPTAPEMLLGALASCLVHTYVIQACLLNLPLDSVTVDIEGALDMAAVIGMMDSTPPILSDLAYTAHVASAAQPHDIERLHAAVEHTCPVLNTLRLPVKVQRKGN
jgi:uncharacterized OsmC-like protein